MRYFHYALADWCHRLFGAKFDTAALCGVAERLKLDLDLVAHDQWAAVHEAGVGLSCVLPDMGIGPDGQSMAPFVPGFNNPEYVERVYAALDTALDRAADAGIAFVLVFTGMRTDEDREEQFARMVKGFTTIKGSAPESLIAKAERLRITFVVEMLNVVGDESTWRGHPGYLGLSTAELVRKVVEPIGSPSFALAFDVYHVTMMGEDPIELIDRFHKHIAYVHVAGVMHDPAGGHHPQNRGELTLDGQAVDFPAVCAKLAEHVPAGTYILLEYIPNQTDPANVEQDLAAAIALCESKIPTT